MLELNAEQPAADWDWRAHYAAVQGRLNAGRVRAQPVKRYEEPAGPTAPVIRDILQVASVRRAKWRDIVDEECARASVQIHCVLSNRRTAHLVAVRRRIAWRLRNETPMSYPQIGRVLGRDHTTAIHHVRAYEAMLARGGVEE